MCVIIIVYLWGLFVHGRSPSAGYPRCRPGLLGFALRDSAGGAPKAGAARTRGGTLAGGATRIRGASGSERPRAAMSSPASLPKEIHRSAERGELQKVVKWLRKGGQTDALCPCTANDGRTSSFTLLHAAAAYGHLAMVRELLKRGASIDLPSSLGATALMDAADGGHLSVLLVLLQHSASIDMQDIDGMTALMMAADYGYEACVKALLRAKANTELLDKDGYTALQRAEANGHTATAQLIRQHAAPPQPAAAAPAAPPDPVEPAESSPASLPLEIYESAQRGELQKVVKWLRKGGWVDALCPTTRKSGKPAAFGLLHAAADKGHLELVRELLKRGASVDLQTSLGETALIHGTESWTE